MLVEWVVDDLYGVGSVGQTVFGNDAFGQRLRYAAFCQSQQLLGKLGDSFGVQPFGLELLGRRIDGYILPVRCRLVVDTLQVGVGNVDVAVEDRRLAHNDVFRVGLQRLAYPLDALKPHQLNLSRVVAQLGCEPHRTPFSYGVHIVDGAPQHHVGIVYIDVSYRRALRTVHIAIGKVLQQVAVGVDIQLALQHCCTCRAYAFKEFYRSVDEEHGRLVIISGGYYTTYSFTSLPNAASSRTIDELMAAYLGSASSITVSMSGAIRRLMSAIFCS